jgi:hypothetical protein
MKVVPANRRNGKSLETLRGKPLSTGAAMPITDHDPETR